MQAILHYIAKMVPFMAAALPAYVVLRYLFVWAQKIEKNILREIGLCLFCLYMTGLFSQTILPEIIFTPEGIKIQNEGSHTNNFIPFTIFVTAYEAIFVYGDVSPLIINFFGNIGIFIPVGFMIKLLWRWKNGQVILAGLLISLFIEFCQLFLPRCTEFNDVILNTMGAALGLLMYRLYAAAKQAIQNNR